MAQENKTCKICQKIGHSRFYCREKGYKPIKYTASTNQVSLKSPPKPRSTKRIPTSGKNAVKWNKTRLEWKKANPVDQNGYRYCKVGGARLVDSNYDLYPEALPLNICHNISRSRSRAKAYDIDNLFAGCPRHNKQQGSMSLDEFLSKNPSLICGFF